MPLLTPEERVGTTIADTYRLESIIGRGGMAVIYRARHLRTARAVAIKIMRPDSQLARQRFLREARIAGEIEHPNVVEVLDLGEEEDGTVFLALELLHGESLGQYLAAASKLTVENALAMALPILDALARLHEAGVVHRDIKPANIYLSLDGAGNIVPKLLDFGISKLVARDETLTEDGALVGTPEYMSPEQVRGAAAVSAATDVWAMGALLHLCLSGRALFAGSSIGDVLARVLTERPPPIASIAPDVPIAVAGAIDRALAYASDERHADARSFAAELERAAIADGIEWPPRLTIDVTPREDAGSEPTASVRRSGARFKLGLAGVSAFAALAIAVPIGFPFFADRSPPEPVRAQEAVLMPRVGEPAPSAPAPVERAPTPPPVIAIEPPPAPTAARNARRARPPEPAPVVVPAPPPPEVRFGINHAPIPGR